MRRPFPAKVMVDAFKRAKGHCDVARLHDFLEYDAVSGLLRRKATLNGMVYPRVGTRTSHGYILVHVAGLRVYAHQIAWAMHHGEWPPLPLDHVNGDKTDNKISNLRLATPRQNLANTPARANSKSGVRGVHLAPRGKWIAQITIHGKCRHLGAFDSLDEARRAYGDAAKDPFGEFRHAST